MQKCTGWASCRYYLDHGDLYRFSPPRSSRQLGRRQAWGRIRSRKSDNQPQPRPPEPTPHNHPPFVKIRLSQAGFAKYRKVVQRGCPKSCPKRLSIVHCLLCLSRCLLSLSASASASLPLCTRAYAWKLRATPERRSFTILPLHVPQAGNLPWTNWHFPKTKIHKTTAIFQTTSCARFLGIHCASAKKDPLAGAEDCVLAAVLCRCGCGAVSCYAKGGSSLSFCRRRLDGPGRERQVGVLATAVKAA